MKPGDVHASRSPPVNHPILEISSCPPVSLQVELRYEISDGRGQFLWIKVLVSLSRGGIIMKVWLTSESRLTVSTQQS